MLNLVQTNWGVFDLTIADPEDVDGVVATLVFAVIFTDAEGPSDRVGDAWSRRGWWADESAGTGVWHVRRQPLTDSARAEAANMIKSALLAKSGAFGALDVTITQSTAPDGNISSLVLAVSGEHNGRKFSFRTPL